MAIRIIRRGADVNFINSNGKTALHLAIEQKNIEAIQFLVKNKADVYIEDKNGE